MRRRITLLGTLLFSKGLYDAGMKQWAEAKRLAPHMPILDADIGNASLQLNDDVPHALIRFRIRLRERPRKRGHLLWSG